MRSPGPGSVVGIVVDVPRVGRVLHKGLLSDVVGADGYPRVVHCSKHEGRVLETTMSAFVCRAVDGAKLRACGYPGRLPRALVLARARSRLGEPYDLVLANCEHFVTWAHGLPPASGQLDAAIARLRTM